MSKGSFDSRTQETVLQEARNTDEYVKEQGRDLCLCHHHSKNHPQRNRDIDKLHLFVIVCNCMTCTPVALQECNEETFEPHHYYVKLRIMLKMRVKEPIYIQQAP